MDNENDKALGLDDTQDIDQSENSSEWHRDNLLIQLEIQLNAIRDGAYKAYGRYLLPLALVFPISGGMIYFALGWQENPEPVWLLYIGDAFLILGCFLVILISMLIGYDFFRSRYINSFDAEKLDEFQCRHFILNEESSGKSPLCSFFNKDLDGNPICLICPVYEATDK